MARDDLADGSWLRNVAYGVGIGAAVAAMISIGRGWSVFLISWAIGSMYSVSIGVPASIVFRRLRPRLSGSPELKQWLIYVGVLLVLTALGSLVTGLATVACGWVPLDDFWANYLGGFKIALVIAVPSSAGAISLSRLHRRIAERDAELAAIELDRQRAVGVAAEARLASLESRVRPHFLFNALNSAIALIADEPARAEAVLERLAALLRFSLDAQHSRLVPLGEEMRIVADYLEIERVRFGERLRYDLDVPAELAAIEIPAFAVQTLVENSVKYAVSARTTGAAIRVRARLAGDRLAIEVSDDGPGFVGEVWLPGHGLEGLRARLDVLYGADARIVAPATAGTGAAVVVELPRRAREVAA